MIVPGSANAVLVSGAEALTLYDAIVAAGLDANLEFALDARDPLSYLPTQSDPQKWLDRSANNCDFYLGADGNSGTDEPAFSFPGSWSYDGGDFHRMVGTNTTFINSIHKDAAQFTLIQAVSLGAANNGRFCGTGTAPGFLWLPTAEAKQQFFVAKSTGGTALQKTGDTVFTREAVHFMAVSLNEAGGAVSFMYLDGDYDPVSGANTWDGAYAEPASGGAQNVFEIGAGGGGNTPAEPGRELIFFGALSVALTKTQLDDLFEMLRGDLGI